MTVEDRVDAFLRRYKLSINLYSAPMMREELIALLTPTTIHVDYEVFDARAASANAAEGGGGMTTEQAQQEAERRWGSGGMRYQCCGSARKDGGVCRVGPSVYAGFIEYGNGHTWEQAFAEADKTEAQGFVFHDGVSLPTSAYTRKDGSGVVRPLHREALPPRTGEDTEIRDF